MRFKPSRQTVAAVVAAVLVILAGSAAVASNMGFKMNKGLYPPNAAKPGAGDNWTSIPFNRPYQTMNDLCTQLALPTGTTVSTINPETGSGTLSCTCGISVSNCTSQKLDLTGPVVALVDNQPEGYLGVKIRSTAFVAGTSSAIIVGSHNPNLQHRLRHIPSVTCDGTTTGASASIGATWLSIPYHTTAVTAQDLCVQLGVPTGPSATITRVDPVNGNQPPVTCNTSGASALNLVLGEAVKVRRTSAGPCTSLTSTPAHF